MRLYVEGELQTRSWEKDGKTNYRTEIILANLIMLDGKKDTEKDIKKSKPEEEPDLSEIPF